MRSTTNKASASASEKPIEKSSEAAANRDRTRPPRASISRLALALAIHQWLLRDLTQPYARRRERDRRIGQDLLNQAPGLSDLQLVQSWWLHRDRIAADELEHDSLTRRIDSGHHWLNLLLMILGVLGGISAATVALTYTGDHPVNLLPLLGVLVGLPGVLLLLSLCGALLSRLGLNGMIQPLRVYQRSVLNWFDRWAGTDLQYAMGHRDVYGRLGYWLLQCMSQRAAIAFFLACLSTLWALIAFTDIAFGWSSTLEISGDHIHKWTRILAWPWHQWLPAAVPDQALIDSSRYFRLGERFTDVEVARFGQWWPFVLMCIAVWGLAPRLLMLLLARYQMRRRVDELLLEHSEVTALIDRLRAPAVQFQTEATATTTHAPAAPVATVAGETLAPVLSWNQARPEAGSIQLGAGQNPLERQRALQQIPDEAQQIRLFTKGWEPPVFELLDAIGEIREHLGRRVSIVVVPVGLEGAPVSAEDLQVWRHALARSGDSRLYVEQTSEAPAAAEHGREQP